MSPENNEFETGEPLAEEVGPTDEAPVEPPQPTGPKIPALRGRFSWLIAGDEKTGQMELSSAKYLTNGGERKRVKK